jgi:hypothetical protein
LNGHDFTDKIPKDIWDLFNKSYNCGLNEDEIFNNTFNSEQKEDEIFYEENDENNFLEKILLNCEFHLEQIEIYLSDENIRILVDGFLFEKLDFFQWQTILGNHYFNINGYFVNVKNISINNLDIKYNKILTFDNIGNSLIDIEDKETKKNPIQNLVDYFQFTYCHDNALILINGECWNDVSIEGVFDL